MNILGIDPGISGGVAIVDSRTMKITAGFRMPTYKEGKKGKKAVSANEVLRLIPLPVHGAVVEQVHAMPKQGVSSTFSFGRSYATALAVAEFISLADVVRVTPQTWKKHHSLIGQLKDKSIQRAIGIFGDSYTWTFKADDGIAEAALLAAWLIDTHGEI
jgi:crossover junction endodeoxyribonuclease RuvC